MAAPASVDAYLRSLPAVQREALANLRATIASAVPDAVETVGWGMPGFKVHGRWLATYSAFKDHYSLFPMSGSVLDDLRKDLGAHVSGKGTIRFEFDRPLPVTLVKKVVKARLREITAAQAS